MKKGEPSYRDRYEYLKSRYQPLPERCDKGHVNPIYSVTLTDRLRAQCQACSWQQSWELENIRVEQQTGLTDINESNYQANE